MNCVVGNLQLVSVLSHLCVMTNGLENWSQTHIRVLQEQEKGGGLSDRETKIRNTCKQPKSSSTLEEVEGYCGHCQYMCGIQAIVGTASTCVVYRLLWALPVHVWYTGYCGHCQYMCGIQAIVGTASTCVVYRLLWALPVHVWYKNTKQFV